jgi:hypothetical protein
MFNNRAKNPLTVLVTWRVEMSKSWRLQRKVSTIWTLSKISIPWMIP